MSDLPFHVEVLLDSLHPETRDAVSPCAHLADTIEAIDPADMSAAELREVADNLAANVPGPLTIPLARLFGDRRLALAVIYRNWPEAFTAGYPLLNDGEHLSDETDLLYLWSEFDGGPRSILVGEDADFYRALPDSITVYRGCSGIDAETAALGYSWTLSPWRAQHYALRDATPDNPAVLVMGRVPKSWIRLAFAKDQELVTQPRKARQINLLTPPVDM